jgi:uroporphyrinogen-III synthase
VNSSTQESRQRESLNGLRILVGRARHQASQLSRGLRELGADVIEIPFIEIRPPRSFRPLDSALQQLDEYDWLILTSVNGVDALKERMHILGLKPSALGALNIAAIGPATRERIESLGLKVDVVPSRYVAESVVEGLRDKMEGKRVLLARAKVARDVIPRELRKLGAKVDVVEAYETVVPRSSQQALQKLMSDPETRPQIVTFTSSSTVRNFVALLGLRERRLRKGDVKFASIGPVTSASMRELGLTVHIEAKKYTIPGLIQAIARSFSPQTRRHRENN